MNAETANEEPPDEDSTQASVAISEGVDRFELRVQHGRVRDDVERVVIRERDEVVHEALNELRRRSDVRGVTWRAPTNPHRTISELTNEANVNVARGVIHQATMPAEERLDR
jgi:DNA transposition AAA+ family ATPase